MTRKDIERLRKAAERLEAEEARMQRQFGDRAKGTQRSAAVAFAKSLRAALAFIEGNPTL